MTLHSSIQHNDCRQDKHCLWHECAFPSKTACAMHNGHVQPGINTTSFISSSAASIVLYFPALCPQTGESGMLAGVKCQPSVNQVDEYTYHFHGILRSGTF